MASDPAPAGAPGPCGIGPGETGFLPVYRGRRQSGAHPARHLGPGSFFQPGSASFALGPEAMEGDGLGDFLEYFNSLATSG